MALSTKLAAAALVAAVVACALAAAPTATASYADGGGAYMPREDCPTQINYFRNCLARDEIRAQCCSVVADHKCLCQLEREVVAVPCHPHPRRYGHPCNKSAAPGVKRSELQGLPCFQKLKC